MDSHALDRRSLAAELLEVTGEAVPEHDPIITGALFFSHSLAKAGRIAAGEIEEAANRGSAQIRDAGLAAAKEMREASRKLALDASEGSVRFDASTRAVEVAIEQMAAEREQLLKAIEV